MPAQGFFICICIYTWFFKKNQADAKAIQPPVIFKSFFSIKGARVGTQKGDSFIIKKRDPIIKIIRERSRDFGGPLNDKELLAVLSQTEITDPKDSKGNTMKVSAKISWNTFYHYKALAREVD